jgi:hypothetical protein
VLHAAHAAESTGAPGQEITMNDERRTDNGRASQVNDTSVERPEATVAAGQDDVAGFFNIKRLGPPVCLPVLPGHPAPRPVFEPLGVPRGRELAP